MSLTTFFGFFVTLAGLLRFGESANIGREQIQLRNEIFSQLEELESREKHLSEKNFIDSDQTCPACSSGFECCVQEDRVGCCRKIQKKSSVLDTTILTSCLNQEYELHQCQVIELQKLNEEFKNPRVKDKCITNMKNNCIAWNCRVQIRGFKLTDTCEVRLRSYSTNNQPPANQYGFIRVNGKDVMKGEYRGERTGYNRGINMAVLDPKSCLPGVQHWFDTFGSATRTRDLINYLESLPTGTILLGVTFDEPSGQLAEALPILRSMGVHVYNVGDRGMFAFVLQKGYPSKTVLEKSASRTSPLELAVQLSGFINNIQISRRT